MGNRIIFRGRWSTCDPVYVLVPFLHLPIRFDKAQCAVTGYAFPLRGYKIPYWRHWGNQPCIKKSSVACMQPLGQPQRPVSIEVHYAASIGGV